jgi:DNA-directed RNA polymerase subunit alpha
LKEESSLLTQFSQIEPNLKAINKKGSVTEFVIEPLLPGYGITLANSLRRVLLSSLAGSAISAVKIKGVSHEFSTIPNIKEDVIEIILNLRDLVLKLHSDKAQTLELKVKGPKKVTAADIKVPSDAEIINPDLYIATLDNKSAELDMEILVEKGIGYLPTEERKSFKLPAGMIAVDAVFTPVRKVSFEIENTRVGEMTNLDKLNLIIETNGTIDAQEALKKAASILIEQFSLFTEPKKASRKVEVSSENKDLKPEKIMVEELDLSPRTTNVLLKNEVNTVKDILKLDMGGLKTLKGLGKTTLVEVEAKLKELGLSMPEDGAPKTDKESKK